MLPLSTLQLPQLLGARPLAAPLPDAPVTGCELDSRRLRAGDVFFAMQGQQQHGCQFAAAALAAGAVCVVTDSPPPGNTHPDLLRRFLLVPNAVTALQMLARWNRCASSSTVIGITGSVGKTSTRQLIAAVLAVRFPGSQSPANFNNELGVPLTLLQLTANDRFAAVELGAARKEDIRFLCELAQPSIAVVTRVAPCHLESFSSLTEIALTKAELPASLPADGTAFLNADDPLVHAMSGNTAARTVFFGEQAAGESRVNAVRAADGRCLFRCGHDQFSFLGGRQLLHCAAAAVAVGREWGLSVSDIQLGLDTFLPGPGRGQVLLGRNWTLIDETYNSSPASLAASIRGMADWQGPRRVLVAGEMLELGRDAATLHRQTAALLADSAVDLAIFVGTQSQICRDAATDKGFPEDRVKTFADVDELSATLPELLLPGDLVLVKGSRGVQLEHVIRRLRELDGPSESFHGQLHRHAGRQH